MDGDQGFVGTLRARRRIVSSLGMAFPDGHDKTRPAVAVIPQQHPTAFERRQQRLPMTGKTYNDRLPGESTPTVTPTPPIIIEQVAAPAHPYIMIALRAPGCPHPKYSYRNEKPEFHARQSVALATIGDVRRY